MSADRRVPSRRPVVQGAGQGAVAPVPNSGELVGAGAVDPADDRRTCHTRPPDLEPLASTAGRGAGYIVADFVASSLIHKFFIIKR